MKRVVFFVVVALLVSTQLCGAQQTQASTPSQASAAPTPSTPQGNDKNIPTFSERYPRYQLRPGDSLDVSFEFTPEFNQSLTILPDGYVALRDAGDIYANGLTVPELTEKIKTAYSHVLSNPRISILLKDFERPYFVADGQVGHPGKYDLRGDTTVIQGIAIAGGFTNIAKHSQVVLYRRVSDNWIEAKLINVKEMEKSRNLSEDMHLKPGDMIYVPKNRLSRIQQFIPSYGVNVLPPLP